MAILSPASESELVDAVATAIVKGQPLAVEGNGSKRGYGRPIDAPQALTTRAMRGVSMYEPSELVLTAAAGTPLSEITALLNQRNQELAFEPMGFGALYGTGPLAGTIGGLVAVNASGPRRIKAGAARDHVLGFRAVSGRAEIFKSGGRVMKNVTGYDLSKLMTGSFGTLVVLSEVTLKVLPRAETETTLLYLGLGEAAAIALMTAASGLQHEISGLAHVPAIAAAGLVESAAGFSLTALRLEGPEVSVVQRAEALRAHFRPQCPEMHSLAEAASKAFWISIRDLAPVAALPADIWRISAAPTDGPGIVEAIRQAGVPAVRWYYDWAGGLVWLAVSPMPDALATPVRAAVSACGGHATLMRAADVVRRGTPVFHPQPPALAALSARVKHNFDPEGVLNPGRMREDF